MTAATNRTRRLGTACDRCHELKERCERIPVASSCVRCNRLGQACLTIRPVRPAGRRPRFRAPSVSQTTSSESETGVQHLHDIGSWLRETPDLDSEEKSLLLFLLGQPQTLQYYVVSPSFENAEQRSLTTPLPAALPVLKDAYLAYAGALKSFCPINRADVDEDANLRRASAAMTTLRNLHVANSEDASLCLTLGIVLALYVYAVIGVGVSDICHYCLNAAMPFIETATLDPEAETRMTFLVLLEIMDCVAYRRKPTLKIQSRAAETVDRHLGLCLPLLPYYHDLCVISNSLATTTDVGVLTFLHHKLDSIQELVGAWQPSQPETFIQQFQAAEVLHLLAQARVYRLAALLLTHRLRHAFGEGDSQADIWSQEVMMELELAHQITKKPIHFVTLPFIIAAVEVRNPAARIKTVQNVDKYVDQFTPVVQRATKTFLLRVWRERDAKPTCSWFDSAHKPCVILDSVGFSHLAEVRRLS